MAVKIYSVTEVLIPKSLSLGKINSITQILFKDDEVSPSNSLSYYTATITALNSLNILFSLDGLTDWSHSVYIESIVSDSFFSVYIKPIEGYGRGDIQIAIRTVIGDKITAHYPEQVTNVIATAEGIDNIGIVWDAAEYANGYELQRRTNWRILSLGTDFAWIDSEALISALENRNGTSTVDSNANITIPEDGFISISQAAYADVTFDDIEISAAYVSGSPTLIIRSDNGAGPNGWHAYVAVINATTITVHTSTVGVLSASIATFTHTTIVGERVSFKVVGTLLTVLINRQPIGTVVDTMYANGVVGFGSHVGTGVWNVSLGEWETISSPITLFYLDESLLDLQWYGYQVRGINEYLPSRQIEGPWSDSTNLSEGQAYTPPILLNETVTASLEELTINPIEIEQTSINVSSEIVTASLEGLTILITEQIVEQTVVDIPAETVTASLENLSIQVQDITMTTIDISLETVAVSLGTLNIQVQDVTRTDVNISETITASLESLTITVSAV